jgi:hypothetical protein
MTAPHCGRVCCGYYLHGTHCHPDADTLELLRQFEEAPEIAVADSRTVERPRPHLAWPRTGAGTNPPKDAA